MCEKLVLYTLFLLRTVSLSFLFYRVNNTNFSRSTLFCGGQLEAFSMDSEDMEDLGKKNETVNSNKTAEAITQGVKEGLCKWQTVLVFVVNSQQNLL